MLCLGGIAQAEEREITGHVPRENAESILLGHVPSQQELHLAIGLALQNTNELHQLFEAVSDPNSPKYRQYITPAEFNAEFAPSPEAYDALILYATSNQLHYTTFSNRLILDVSGSATNIEKALHIKLNRYQHPNKGTYFAPENNPTVPANLSILNIQGLNDLARPRPHIHHTDKAKPANGSGSSGSYLGNDFRTAYATGTTLTGAGQSVGLLQFDGYYAADIQAYAQLAGNGRTNIHIVPVLLDGYNGVPTTNGNDEVSLDIEMSMAMAPGLSNIVVFSGGPNGNPDDVLNSMLSYAATVKNLSSSWGWSGGPDTTANGIFQSMAVQGQTFFNASGDTCSFTAGANSANGVDNVNLQNCPSSSPYITQVGGTTLTMNGTAASYSAESVWNWGIKYGSSYDGVGSSGGVSTYYARPSWQTNIPNVTARGGSTTKRNIPDVALTGDNIYIISGGNQTGTPGFGGTSCAAPLWAGYMALVNQELSQHSLPAAGFINPTIYTILAQPNQYTNCFNDVTNSNNTWSGNTTEFYAATNYDLCSGIGTPRVGLIAAFLPGITNFSVNATNVTGGRLAGGGVTWNPGSITVSNSGTVNLNWTVTGLPSWLATSGTNGTLTPGSLTNLTLKSTSATSNLFSGTYNATVQITNPNLTTNLYVTLNVTNPLVMLPNYGLYAVGPVGGPIAYYPTSIVLTNEGTTAIKWGIQNSTNWLNISPSKGTNAAGTSTTIALSATTNANSYPTYVYNFYADITNAYGTNTFANSLIITTPLVFSNISKTNSNIKLQWTGSPYAYYQAWYSTNLTTTNWYALTAPFLPTNSAITILDTNTTFPSKFYQLQILP